MNSGTSRSYLRYQVTYDDSGTSSDNAKENEKFDGTFSNNDYYSSNRNIYSFGNIFSAIYDTNNINYYTTLVIVDNDGDGLGDNADPDDDNDGVVDSSDAFPNDSNETKDTDRDGVGDNADFDDDGDGVIDSNDAFPLDSSERADADGDGIGDNAEPCHCHN